MRYTQSQIRELLSISIDALRVWRDAVPSLANHKGHAPTFTPGDVVAVAILAELVRNFGVRVTVVSDRVDQLFTACHGKSWLSLESCVVLFEADAIRLVEADDPRHLLPAKPVIYFPCAPIVARLQAALVATEAHLNQGHLQFPPTNVRVGMSQ